MPDSGVPDAGTPTATLTLSDAPTYDYGTRPVGIAIDRAFTVTNSGTGPASSLAPEATGGLATPFSFKGGSYPGQGGTCAATLEAGQSCTVVVTYAPSATGASTGTLALGYNDGTAARTVSRALTGNAVPPASLELSDAPLYDYGQKATGSSTDHAFTLTNRGGFIANTVVPAPGLTGPFNYKGGFYPGDGGTCTSTLDPGASCTVVVTYAPVSSGTATATVTVSYHDGLSARTATRDVRGGASAPAQVSISDGAVYDFGTRAVGSTVDKTFTVSNPGGLAATDLVASGLSAPFSFKGGSYPGEGGTCGTSLPSLGSCTLVVTYAPTSLGTVTQTLSLAYNDGGNTRTATREVRGTAINPAWLSLSDAPTFHYGTRAVGSSTDHTFTVTNSGGVTATGVGATLMLRAPFSFKGGGYPGQGGTCTSTLPANASCTVVVTFAPTSSGSFTSTVGILYFDGAATRTATRTVTGAGTTEAFLAISDGPVFDFGVHAAGSSTDHAFTVTNTGNRTATAITAGMLSAPFSYKGGAYPGVGGTCGASLAVNATCTVVVTFAPVVAGVRTDTLSLAYNDGNGAQTASVGLRGTGTGRAALSLSDGPTYDYGALPLGATADHAFTVTNSGADTATNINPGPLSAPFAFKGGSYPGQGGTCGASLAVNATCTLVVTFAPTETGVAHTTLTLTYFDGQSQQIVNRPLTGTGLAPALLSISDGPAYDFGVQPIGSVITHTLTVSNSGGVAATNLAASGLSAPFDFAGGSYPGTGGTCGATLQPAESCTLVVAFAPTAAGPQMATLSLGYHNGASTRTVTRELRGTGAAPALVSISDAPAYDFGAQAVGSATEHVFTLTNSGGVPATGFSAAALPAPFAFKGGDYPGQGGTCGSGLIAGGSCTVVVTFSPTATGPSTATLDLAYHDGVAIRHATRDLSGTGAAPALLSFSGFDYGVQPIGSSTDHTFTVTNTGGVTATNLAPGTPGMDFMFAGGAFPGTGGTCGGSLAAGQSCTFVLTFQPSQPGLRSFDLRLDYFDGAAARSVSRQVSGTGAMPAVISFVDAPGYDFGTQVIGSAVERAFTLTNSGGTDATNLAASSPGGAFTFEGGSYPGAGATCGTTLAAGASCTVVVTFAPTHTGQASATLTIAYRDGANARSASLPVSGTGADPAALSLSGGPILGFGVIVVGGSQDRELILSNPGGVTATGITAATLPAPFAFKGGGYPGTGGTCGGQLGAGESCTLVLTFSPTASGEFSATLSLGYHNGLSTRTVTRELSGTGVEPALLSFSGFDYGVQPIGSSTDHTFTVTNTGGVTATNLAPGALETDFMFAGGAFPGTGGTCGGSLAAGQSCTFVLTFQPSQPGLRSFDLRLDYFDGAAARSVSRQVSGTGAMPALLGFADAPGYDFGTRVIGSSTDRAFTVTNSGGLAATDLAASGLGGAFTFKGGDYPGTGGTCGTTLAAGTSCTVVVTFAPTSAGEASATLGLAYRDGANARSTSLALSGTGAEPASLALSDTPLFDFGSAVTGASAEHAFTLTNPGGVTATNLTAAALPAPFSFTGGSYPGAGGTCGSELAPGASCSLRVTFSPTASGPFSATLRIDHHNGLSTATASVDLSGTGVTPALLDFAGFDYGQRAIGSSTNHTFTVTNSGGSDATAIARDAPGVDFAFNGGTCGPTLAAGQSCTLIVTFQPTQAVARSFDLRLSYFDGSGGRTVSRTVSGTGVDPAELWLDGGAIYDFGPVGVGGAEDHAVRITNTGGHLATGISAVAISAPFSFKGGDYPGHGGSCGATLAPGESCLVMVTFAPTAAGFASAEVTLAYQDGSDTRAATQEVRGTGTSGAALVLTDWPAEHYANSGLPPDGLAFEFGAHGVGSVADHTFWVRNTGAGAASALTAASPPPPFSFKGGSFPGQGGTCGNSLAPGEACSIVLAFAPTEVTGNAFVLTVNYDDGAATQVVQRMVLGSGTDKAVLRIDDFPGIRVGGAWDFGSVGVGQETSHEFVVRNTGALEASSVTASLSAPFSYAGGTFPGQGGTCGASLASGASCTVVVRFAPSASGAATGTLGLTYDDGESVQTVSRNLRGHGTQRALLVIGLPNGGGDGFFYDFGTHGAGQTREQTFELRNIGGQSATALSPAALPAPFAFKGGGYPGQGGTCGGTSLAVGESCTVVVTFTPTGNGTSSASLAIPYNDGAATRTASKGLKGTGTTLAHPAFYGDNGRKPE